MDYLEAFAILILSILGINYVDRLLKKIKPKEKDKKLLLYFFATMISVIAVFGLYKAMTGFAAMYN